jgi:hypothetical protein
LSARASTTALVAGANRGIAEQLHALMEAAPTGFQREGAPHRDRSKMGADAAVWLATLPDDEPTEGFFYDRKRIPW